MCCPRICSFFLLVIGGDNGKRSPQKVCHSVWDEIADCGSPGAEGEGRIYRQDCKTCRTGLWVIKKGMLIWGLQYSREL